jgi:hypothetical protein
MSSVTRFIRQIPLATTYYNVTSGILAGTGVYEFVPTGGNYVGNYPPGYMQLASDALKTALVNAGTSTTLVLRDMGKTIFAPVGTSASADAGYFRQVQLLKPTPVTAAQGFIGGTAGNNFGVLGDNNTPDAYTDFMTFYIAVPVAGVLGGVLSGLTPIAGGQM